MSTDRITYLLQAFSNRQATRAEEDELFQWITVDGNEEIVKTHIANLVTSHQQQETFANVNWENIYQSILQKRTTAAAIGAVRTLPTTDHHHKIFPWKKLAIAASIIGLIFLALVVVLTNKPGTVINNPVAQTDRFKSDINPGNAKATLTLSDGSVIVLDSAINGQLTIQNNVSVTKTADGQIIYAGTSGTSPSPNGEGRGEVLNTLTNPRGSIVMNMTLSDGSKVWLNAGSSITYPVAFISNQRKITITGEGYFEIAHNKSKPFIVSANNKADVTVLGTHFNVNAYDDESDIKVTLIEGSVQVGPSLRGTKQSILKSGQQAVLNHANPSISQIMVQTNVDLAATLAWRNGIFKFSDAGIEELMRQFARWYNVEIEYEQKPTDHFIVTIPRTVTLVNALKILEETGRVRFRTQGNKIIVLANGSSP